MRKTMIENKERIGKTIKLQKKKKVLEKYSECSFHENREREREREKREREKREREREREICVYAQLRDGGLITHARHGSSERKREKRHDRRKALIESSSKRQLSHSILTQTIHKKTSVFAVGVCFFFFQLLFVYIDFFSYCSFGAGVHINFFFYIRVTPEGLTLS